MNSIKKICLSIIIGLSAFGVCGATVLFFVDIPKSALTIISTCVGIVGTFASVILSIVAMIYSNKSSEKAEESLNAIKDHYENFCAEIRNRAITDNLGKNSIENIMEKQQEEGIDVIRPI